MQERTTGSRADRIWAAADRLLEDASLQGILAHNLGPLAANRLRRLGEPVPAPLVHEERAASLSMLTAVPLMERIRASSDEVLVLMKGPEVAGLYPGSARRFSDVDLLSDAPHALQRSLLTAGFEEFDDPEFEFTAEHHHLQPLKWPTIWLKVEVHVAPNWPRGLRGPPLLEILEAAAPSATRVDGFVAPHPAHHAVILAAHAWAHEPLQTLRDLIDIEALAAQVDERDVARTAKAWALGRVWETTRRAIDGVFYGGRPGLPLRTWARHLPLVRERTVLERHLGRLTQGYWGLPPHLAAVETGRGIHYLVAPVPGETWGEKLSRVSRALRRPGAPVGRRRPGRRP